jgi:type IV secretory pathway VirB10-like protein
MNSASPSPADAEPPGKPPPQPVLMTPPRRITRYRPVVVAGLLGGVSLIVGMAFVIGFSGPVRPRGGPAPAAESGEAPSDPETGPRARYDDPAAFPPPGAAGLPPPEGASDAARRANAAGPSAPPAMHETSPEVQRARQDAQAARASGPFFGGGAGARHGASTGVVAPTAPASLALGVPTAPGASATVSTAKEQFIETNAARGPQAPILPRAPLSPWEVKAGSLISAALITGINSDLPGPVIAQVTEPVFDHRSGRRVLIPQGARLIGRYDSQVGHGQERVLVVWTQIVFPSGRTVDLGAMVGLDAAGMSGLTGTVNNHVPRLARAIGLSTLISIGGAAAQNSVGRRGERVALQDAAGGVAAAAAATGQRLVDRDLQRAPTLVIAPGQSVRVLVDRDLILPPEASEN